MTSRKSHHGMLEMFGASLTPGANIPRDNFLVSRFPVKNRDGDMISCQTGRKVTSKRRRSAKLLGLTFEGFSFRSLFM